MYLTGRIEGVPNDEQAEHWFREAVEKESSSAQFNLGWMYLEGRIGDAPNYRRAATLLRLAAAQGDVGAQTLLEQMYEDGRAVPPNVERAVRGALLILGLLFLLALLILIVIPHVRGKKRKGGTFVAFAIIIIVIKMSIMSVAMFTNVFTSLYLQRSASILESEIVTTSAQNDEVFRLHLHLMDGTNRFIRLA